MIKNAFFDIALQRASKVLGRRSRVLMLVGQLGMKLRNVNWNDIDQVEVREKFALVGRLLKAYAQGRYQLPWKTMLLITGVVLYFMMPIDVIPDVIPALGLTDDFAILLAVYQSLRGELEKFALWERSNPARL